MSIRFQKRISILPGLSINLGKSGGSVSIGPRGAKTTISSKGVKRSYSIPGTGIRYETPYQRVGQVSSADNVSWLNRVLQWFGLQRRP